jgi:hypothetical protein
VEPIKRRANKRTPFPVDYFYSPCNVNHTAKTQYRKFETNIPRKETVLPVPIPAFVHVSVSDLYISTIGLPVLLQENRWTDLGNIYCRSLTDT